MHKITQNLENFHYNVIIANLHEIYNFFSKAILDKDLNIKSLNTNYLKILKIISPILPHLSSECMEDLGQPSKFNWPAIEEKYLSNDVVKIVIQFNGKKRGIIECQKDINEKDVIDLVKNTTDLKKYFLNSEIMKNIYVKNKIINFILK